MSALKIVTDDRVARYVAAKNKGHIAPPYTSLGVERDGQIVAGAVFRNYTGPDVDVTVVGDCVSAFTPKFIRAIGRYVFMQMGCLRLSMVTTQPRVIALALRLGAKVEGVKRNGFGQGEDATMLGVLSHDWKFK